MGRLTPGEFLLELNKLYDMNKEKGSVYVEMKRSKAFTLLCVCGLLEHTVLDFRI